MSARKVAWMALVVGALALASAAGAQPAGGDGKGGGRGGPREGAQGKPPAVAPNVPGNAGPGGPGGDRQWDPERMQQMQERMQQRRDEQMKTALQMTDMEWLALDAKIQKVQSLQREIDMAAGSGFGGRMGRGGMGGQPGQPPRAPGAGREPQTEVGKAMQELQTTLDKKDAAPDEITGKLQALRDARAKLPEELAKAKADLLVGLTPRQEAQLVMMGIIQ